MIPEMTGESEKKKAFIDSKIKKLKKLKNQDFSEGVSPWFW